MIKVLCKVALVMAISTHAFGDLEKRVNSLEKDKSKMKLSGFISMNWTIKDYDDDSKKKGGDLGNYLLNFSPQGKYNDKISYRIDYRFYSYMSTLKQFEIKYNKDSASNSDITAGIIKVPYGVLGADSHSFWYGLNYYIGLTDDYDTGFSYNYKTSEINYQLAFFKNSETGASDLKRYSYDPVEVSASNQFNSESNQLNFRVEKTTSKKKYGLSAQAGQLYNSSTDKNGTHNAVAIHWDHQINKFGYQLVLNTYEYKAENPVGVSNKSVLIGAFNGTTLLAAKGDTLTFNLRYDVDFKGEVFKKVRFYNDYSYLNKSEESFHDSYINTTGALFSGGPFFMYVDFIHSHNALSLTEAGNSTPFETGTGDSKTTRFNVNLGYNF